VSRLSSLGIRGEGLVGTGNLGGKLERFTSQNRGEAFLMGKASRTGGGVQVKLNNNCRNGRTVAQVTDLKISGVYVVAR